MSLLTEFIDFGVFLIIRVSFKVSLLVCWFLIDSRDGENCSSNLPCVAVRLFIGNESLISCEYFLGHDLTPELRLRNCLGVFVFCYFVTFGLLSMVKSRAKHSKKRAIDFRIASVKAMFCW